LNEQMQGLMPPRVRAQAVRVQEVRQAVPEERREEVRLSLFLDALDTALSLEGTARSYVVCQED